MLKCSGGNEQHKRDFGFNAKKNYGQHEKKPLRKEDHAAALVVYLNIIPMPLS